MRTLLLVTMCACAAPVLAQEAPDSAHKAPQVQPGFGTLKQDEFTMVLRSGALLVKATPLNERVIRLAAPDTYTRLHALAESRRGAAKQRTDSKDPELFLVSFFSYQPDVTFNPEDLQLEFNGKLLRPGAIIPLTPTWGKQQMDQQETQAAVYVFRDALDYELPVVVRYGTYQNDDWQRIIPKLQQERTKVIAKQQKS